MCEEEEQKGSKRNLVDPVISVCSCKGSSGFIHLNCLREWLNSKRKVTKMSEFHENYIYRKS